MISSALKIYLARQYARLYPRETFVVASSKEPSRLSEMLEKVLSQKYKTVYASHIGDTILRLNPAVKRAILGVHTSQDIDLLLSMLKPNLVIFDKSFGRESGKLLSQMSGEGVAIVSFDDLEIKKNLQDFPGQTIVYGLDPKSATWAGNIKIENFRTTFELNFGVERVKVNLALLGEQHVFSALAASALGVLENLPLTKIKIALEQVLPLPHQMEVLQGPSGSVIVDDNLIYNPATLDDAINTLLQIPSRRKVLVLSEMKDLGEDGEKAHRQAAQKIYKEKIDLVFLGQGQACIIAEELQSLGFWQDKMETNLTHSQMVAKLLQVLGKDDVCLIKGARTERLDEVVKRVTKN